LAGRKGDIDMKRAIFAACMMVAVGLVLSCSKTDEDVVARLGGEDITAGMIKDEYLAISEGARPVLTTMEEKEQFVRDVLSKEILEREAMKLGLDVLPEVQQTRQNAVQRKAWELYYNDNVRSKVEVSEQEIKDLYDMQRYRYHLGWIFVRSRAQADDLARRIAAGEDFEALAAKYSIDASRIRGGDIGVRALGTLPAEVEKMVSKMAVGTVSDPIEYGGHYMLVKVFERDDTEPPDFETLREGLVSMVRTRKETVLQQRLAEELKQKYGLKFHDDVVDMIVAKTRALYPVEAEAGKIPEFSDEELGRVVAEYDGGEWRVRTYVEKIQAQQEFMRPAYGTDAETIKNVIGDYITGELWMREIQSKGYEQRPEVMRAAERATEEALITAMHREVVKDVEVDDEKLRDFYTEHKDELWSDAGAKLAVITTETEDEAQSIYDELQAGGDFAELAREKSFDRVSGEEGGELRTALYDRQLEAYPDILELVNNTAVGRYSHPIAMPAGFMPGEYIIVKVLDKIESVQLQFDEIKQMLGQRVVQFEQDKAFGTWLSGKMEEYGVEIYPEPLAQIDFSQLKG
jgi:parvulin-like peptidyl-prolyl isomerase